MKAPDSVAKPQRGEAARRSSVDKILRSSRTLFLDGGFDGVNLDQIAEHAGVSRQTVYNRFGSKEAVFRAMVERHWAALETGTPTTLTQHATPEDPAEDPAEVLRLFASAILRFVRDHQQVEFTRLVIAESRRHPWIAEDFYRLGKLPLMRSLVGHLNRLSAAGAISCPDPDLAAHQYLGLIQEFVIWPKVMAIGPAADTHAADVVVEEAITTFLSRYARESVVRSQA